MKIKSFFLTLVLLVLFSNVSNYQYFEFGKDIGNKNGIAGASFIINRGTLVNGLYLLKIQTGK